MRLIDADRLKRQVEGRSWRAKGKMVELIDNSPTIEAEPVKHGRWVVSLLPGSEHVSCSECGAEYYEDDLLLGGNEFPRYCPNCGVRMFTEGEDA